MPTTRSLARPRLQLPRLRGGAPRFLGMLAGCVVAAAGIAATLGSGLGVGPYDVLNSGVAGQLGVTFGTANVLVSVTACLVGWRLGAKVGPGTLAAMLCIGPMIDGWLLFLPAASGLPLQLLSLFGGLLVLSFGLSLLIAADLGPGPVEVLTLGIVRRGVPLRWARTALEVGFCVVGVMLGGAFGVGTLVIALLIGHTLSLFVPRESA